MKKIKFYNKDITLFVYILLIFPLLSENVISTLLGDSISKLLSAISCGFILMTIFFQNRLKLNIFLIIMLLAIIEHTFITFVLAPSDLEISHYNNLITPYGLIAYFILFCFIYNNMDSKVKLLEIFKAMMIIMTISVVLNLFITGDFKLANNIEVFKEALQTGYTNSRKWLFGHRNMIFIHHLLWIAITYMYYELKNTNPNKILFFEILFTLLVGVISWNSTMIVTTVMLSLLWMLKGTKILKKIKPHTYLLFYLILEFGIVFFRMQEYFSYIIVELLHRNLSFTGRTEIWDYYIQQFVNSNFLNQMLGNFGITTIGVNAHNMFLGILAFSGAIGVCLYFLLVFISVFKLDKIKNNNMSVFLSIIIFCFFINSLTMEFYIQPLLPLFFGCIISELLKIKKEGNENEKSLIYN